jgi:hypothetical protein
VKHVKGSGRNRGVSNILFAASVTILIIACLAIGIVGFQNNSTLQRDLNTLQSNYNQLQSSYQSIQTQLSSLQTALNNLQTSNNQPVNQNSPSPTAGNGTEKVDITDVLISENTVSISASSKGGSDVTLTRAILEDDTGNVIATNDSVNATLPASGAERVIEVNFTGSDIGNLALVILITSNGNNFRYP